MNMISNKTGDVICMKWAVYAPVSKKIIRNKRGEDGQIRMRLGLCGYGMCSVGGRSFD